MPLDPNPTIPPGSSPTPAPAAVLVYGEKGQTRQPRRPSPPTRTRRRRRRPSRSPTPSTRPSWRPRRGSRPSRPSNARATRPPRPSASSSWPRRATSRRPWPRSARKTRSASRPRPPPAWPPRNGASGSPSRPSSLATCRATNSCRGEPSSSRTCSRARCPSIPAANRSACPVPITSRSKTSWPPNSERPNTRTSSAPPTPAAGRPAAASGALAAPTSPANPAELPVPKNFGEAIIMQMQSIAKEQPSDPRMNPKAAMGLNRASVASMARQAWSVEIRGTCPIKSVPLDDPVGRLGLVR